jgi:phenylalanyl-tRNA synthetase beta chain
MLSILDKLFSLIGKKYKIKQSSNQTFIENRRADIIVDNKKIGFIGEVHPKVLNNWKIEKPVVAFELDVEKLL